MPKQHALVIVIGRVNAQLQLVSRAYELADDVALLCRPPYPQQEDTQIEAYYPQAYVGNLPGNLYNRVAFGLSVQEEAAAARAWFGLEEDAEACILLDQWQVAEYGSLFPDFVLETIELPMERPATPLVVTPLAVAVHSTGQLLLTNTESGYALPESSVGPAQRIREACDTAVTQAGLNVKQGWCCGVSTFDHPDRSRVRSVAYAQSYLVDTYHCLPELKEGCFWWPLDRLTDIEHRMIDDHAEIVRIMTANMR